MDALYHLGPNSKHSLECLEICQSPILLEKEKRAEISIKQS